MTGIAPVVRQFVLCEDVRVDNSPFKRVTLVNLLHTIRSNGIPPFPYSQREFCAYLEISAVRGGNLRIVISHASTNIIVFRTPDVPLGLDLDPRKMLSLSFRMRNCTFPSAGVYWVELWYNHTALVQQSILVRS